MTDMPPPPPPDSQAKARLWSADWWKTQKLSVKWTIAIVVVVLLFSVLPKGSKSETSTASNYTNYRWQSGTCDEWGYEGIFTNKSSMSVTYKLWAEVVDGSGNQIDRDLEYVQNLKPGQSETVKFIFGASTYAKCRFVSVEYISID